VRILPRGVLVPVLLALTTATSVEAQIGPTVSPAAARWYRTPDLYGGYGNYGGFASTPYEGAARGFADVIRARGYAAESTANALLTYEEARSRFFDNKLKWTEIYWARRRLNESERQQDYDKMRTRRDNWRNNRVERVAALNPSQLDPSSGKIYWPTPLQAAQFYDGRKKIDELFLTRSRSSIPGLDQEINLTTQAMKDQLKDYIETMTPHEYLAARKFLDGLNYEIQAPPQG
jgi:hypothetical protein